MHCCVIDCNYPTYWLLLKTGMAHFKNIHELLIRKGVKLILSLLGEEY